MRSFKSLKSKRGPRSREWHEACVRHALRSYSNPRALRRNPLIELVSGETGSDPTLDQVAVLRSALRETVDAVLSAADEVDKGKLETVLRGAMRGRTMQAVATDLCIGREWLYKTWWPEAIRLVTVALLTRHGRMARSEPSVPASGTIQANSKASF